MKSMDSREDRFRVAAFDCRPDGWLKPNVLMQYLQESAARHAEQLGVGFAALDRQDAFWALVNLRLEMSETPRWGDCLTVRTWPSGLTRLLAFREFLGADAEGRELFRATSEWMILDKHGSRPKNLHHMDLHLPRTAPRALGGALDRLRPASACVPADTILVPFSALDFNGHVNNTEYVRWALDALHRRLGRCPPLRSVQTTYLAEVFEAEQIEVLVAADGAMPIHILERKAGSASVTDVFAMDVSWDETKGRCASDS
jgi:medium-chain acyl-[acyl-carrier-protein] hydrolase